MPMLEERVLQGLSSNSSVASTVLELVGNLFGVSCEAVDFDDVNGAFSWNAMRSGLEMSGMWRGGCLSARTS